MLSPLLPRAVQVHVSTLANGLPVWVQRHPYPSGHVALGLQLGVGSLCEEEEERGWAHFLEHMAFTGTRHFGPGELERFFSSLGTTLGHHHNAATTLEFTRFTLALPTRAAAVIQRGLTLLADFACGMTLAAPEIERQRGVILEEIRARQDAAARAQEALLAALVPGSRVAVRHPLGTPRSLRTATPARLEAFYRRWYRPDLATLAVVGDLEVGEVVQWAERAFASWRAAGPAPPRRDSGVTASGDVRAVALRSPALTHVQVSHRVVRPDPVPQTEADVANRWTARLAWWVLNRRLFNRLASGELCGEEAHLSSSELVQGWSVTRAVAVTPRGRAELLLEALLIELQRARLHGFHPAEVEAARAALVARLREAVQAYPTRPAAAVLGDLLGGALGGRPPLAPAQRLDLAERLLPGIQDDQVGAALTTALPTGAGVVAAMVPALKGVATPPASRLLAAHHNAVASSPPPLFEPPVQRLPVLLPPGGAVMRCRRHRTPAVTSLYFHNGAIVHLATTPQRPGRTFLTLTLAGGRIREQEGCLGITRAALIAARHPATRNTPAAKFRDVLNHLAVSLEATADEDCVTFSAALRGDALEATLELMYAFLTEAHLNRTAFAHWRQGVGRLEKANHSNLEAQLAQTAAAMLSGGDPRFRLLTQEDARALTWRATQRWLESEVCGAPAEAAIVGDFELSRAERLATRSLGSLPRRPDRRAELEARRHLPTPSGPRSVTITVPTPDNTAALLVGWRAAPWWQGRIRHRLKVAEYILAQRLQEELRERRGLTYSAQCSYTASKAYPAMSLLAVACLLPPGRHAEAATAIQETVSKLAADGPSPEEMAAARTYFVRAVRRLGEDPRQLARLFAESSYRRKDIRRLTRLDEDYLAMDPDAVRDVLRATCQEHRLITVLAQPERKRGER